MENYKDNWRKFHPPTIPIYFIDIDSLKELLENNPQSVSDEGLDMMLGYFEEYEKYEKAAVVRDAKWKRNLFSDEFKPKSTEERMQLPDARDSNKPDFPPPDDNPGWTWLPNEKQWVRKATEAEMKRYMIDQNDVNKDGNEPNRSTDTDNPYGRENPFE